MCVTFCTTLNHFGKQQVKGVLLGVEYLFFLIYYILRKLLLLIMFCEYDPLRVAGLPAQFKRSHPKDFILVRYGVFPSV